MIVYKGGKIAFIDYLIRSIRQVTNVAVYTRVFSEEDREGLEIQEEICLDFCDSNSEALFGDTEINYIIISDIVSKADTDRALLSSGMRELRKTKDIHYLVVKDLQVITSDIGVMNDFIDDLNHSNIRLIVAEEGYEKVVDNAIRLNQELRRFIK